jgi:hypothetical protein
VAASGSAGATRASDAAASLPGVPPNLACHGGDNELPPIAVTKITDPQNRAPAVIPR